MIGLTAVTYYRAFLRMSLLNYVTMNDCNEPYVHHHAEQHAAYEPSQAVFIGQTQL
jgi:hypothetical protein